MDKFEKLIKDSVQGYEAPYNPDAWKSLNKKLGPSKATISKWIIGSAAAIAVLAVSYNYMASENNSIENNSIIAEDNSYADNVVISDKVQNSVNDINKTNSNNLNTENKSNPTNQTNFNNEGENTGANESESNTDFNVEAQPNVVFPDNSLVEIETSSEEEENNITPETVEFNAGVIINGVEKCLNEQFTFLPSVPKQKAIYEWDLGDGTITTGGVINHTYKSSGIYSVQLTLKDLKSKKVIKTSKAIDVTVLSIPQTNFVFEEIDGIIPETHFKNKTQNANSIQWEIVGLHSSTRNEFNYSFKRKGDYVVNLTTTQENGCQNTATKVIKVENDYNLLAPTAFSPNDDYLNDDFMPKALPLLDLPFTMTIYDRQGKMVYQTSDSNQPWDGLYTKDGVPAPSGVYIWVVQLTNENGEVEMYQNQITIAR